jgi:sugar/nucleoside kinase (ribokinase family)
MPNLVSPCLSQADDKLRTDVLEVQGGGNCGNALTAVARLGAKPYVITKVSAAQFLKP